MGAVMPAARRRSRLARRESPRTLTPFRRKARATTGSPQTPLVTPTIPTPLGP